MDVWVRVLMRRDWQIIRRHRRSVILNVVVERCSLCCVAVFFFNRVHLLFNVLLFCVFYFFFLVPYLGYGTCAMTVWTLIHVSWFLSRLSR